MINPIVNTNAADFKSAAEDLEQIRKIEADLAGRIEAMKYALALTYGRRQAIASRTSTQLTPEISITTVTLDDGKDTGSAALHGLRDSASRYRIKAQRCSDQLAIEIEQPEFELSELKPELQHAIDAYEASAIKKTDEIAETLRPRHRAAVLKIAQALESLSQAIAAERQIHHDLAVKAPRSGSRHLPNFMHLLAAMRTDDAFSAASQWGRAVEDLLQERRTIERLLRA